MDWEAFLRANGLDRYDRIARIYPALLCLLPIFVVVTLWLPQVWTLLGGVTSLVLACGLIFYLAQLVRYRGRQVEKQLGRKVGRAKTAVLLSHADPHIPADTKARYHRYLRDHGISIPDKGSETSDPVAADQAFRSAVDWLLEHTRPNAKASLLYNENIAYGFRRNLMGLKPIAVVLILLALAANTYFILTSNRHSRMVAAIVVELFLLVALGGWLYEIRSAFVEDASLAYAQRFLAQCEQMEPPLRPKRPKKAPR